MDLAERLRLRPQGQYENVFVVETTTDDVWKDEICLTFSFNPYTLKVAAQEGYTWGDGKDWNYHRHRFGYPHRTDWRVIEFLEKAVRDLRSELED